MAVAVASVRTPRVLSVIVTGTVTSMLSSAEAIPLPTARRPPVSRAVWRPRLTHRFITRVPSPGVVLD
ncbi:hypothetical protein ASG41_18665 [Modestobacter sp. Leaf380]|nr:hypothetical protein ASG41_18665 [Modestobacter sp. Leaf380]